MVLPTRFQYPRLPSDNTVLSRSLHFRYTVGVAVFEKLNVDDYNGSFADFKCENKDLKDVIIEDFLNELKLEFG